MFFTTEQNTLVEIAIKEANDSILLESLVEAIKYRPKFDMSTIDNEDLANAIEKFFKENTFRIVIYKPLWRWSRALGYYTHEKPLTIHLNKYRLNRTIASLVGTFYHELVHMVDYFDIYDSYGHGDNSPKGKENTAPYAIGNIAKAMVSNIEPTFKDLSVGDIELNDGLWFRFKNFIKNLF